MVTATMLNAGTTCGFKQCILRGEDANNYVTFRLNAADIEIVPFESSNCHTTYTEVPIPPGSFPTLRNATAEPGMPGG
jgi:hypothetical protein